MCYATFKIWRGISTYQCPKCEKIYVSEVTSSKHLGSEEQKQRFKVQDEIKNNKNERVGLIEREETGVVRTDYFENKAKCNRCGYKWSFKSSNSDRVG
jgi:DNA-directed RNA polymerase subunit RPC12/RpoP